MVEKKNKTETRPKAAAAPSSPAPTEQSQVGEPIAVATDKLKYAIALLSKVTPRKTTIPVLQCVKLACSGGRLTLSATDLDNEIIIRLRGRGGSTWQAVVPADVLDRVLKGATDDATVSVGLGGGQVKVSAGTFAYDLSTLGDADLPTLKRFKFKYLAHFGVPSGALARMIAKTQFAISTEETRYYLNGIYLHSYGKGKAASLRGVATDGRRLAYLDVVRPVGAGRMPGIIIPHAAVKLLSIIAPIAENLRLSVAANGFEVAAGNCILRSKAIDGTYPDYLKIMPSTYSRRAAISRGDMDGTLKRANSFSTHEGRGALLGFGRPADKMTAEVNDPEIGKFSETLSAEFEGEPLNIGFNITYLRSILKVMDGDTIEIEMGESGDPAMFSAPGVADHRIILMPMRI